MEKSVKYIMNIDTYAWDKYVYAHPHGSIYHLSGWKNVIEAAYGHKPHYLIASSQSENSSNCSDYTIAGILPLVQLKNWFFGNSLISLPYVDAAGVLADSILLERKLLQRSVEILKKVKGTTLEIRQTHPFHCDADTSFVSSGTSCKGLMELGEPNPDVHFYADMGKVRIMRSLPEASEQLLSSFKSKLRSQIRKPIREGLRAAIGGQELLTGFYDVFSINMRDLGSPVHSKKFFTCLLNEFREQTKIFLVFKGDQPVAGSLVLGFQNILSNPWASSLKKYSRLSPNMLLYWTMLEYACYRRHTPDPPMPGFKETHSATC